MTSKLIRLTIIVLFSMSSVGCSAVRLMQTRAGVAVTKTVEEKPEERRTPLTRRDFQLDFSASGSQLGVRLEYRPYYSLETQEIVTYTPDAKATTAELLMGLTTSSLFVWAFVDNLVETGEVAVNDDGELYNVTEFDWDGASSLQKAIIIGVPLDMVLSYYAGRAKMKVQEPWKKKGEFPDAWQLLGNHPYRIDLPDHNFGKDYQSRTGNDRIHVRQFLTGIRNPIAFMDVDSVSVRASTDFDGKGYKKTLRFTTQSQLQPFREVALADKGIDMFSTGKPRLMPRPEVTFQWNENPLQAGKVASLWVTVKNTGKGTLYRLTALTVSPDATLNNRELKFGKIDPGDSMSVSVAFKIDKLKRTQDIPIQIRFAEYNDYVPRNIESLLRVVENPRPKFNYAYRVVDGGTATSVGNGDGIFQRGESADIQVTIRNSGSGSAAGVTARLSLLDRVGVEIYGDTFVNLQTLNSGDTKLASFNVGVKGNASINTLRLKLSIQENNFGTETHLTETISLPISQVTAPKIKDLNLIAWITSNSAQVYNGASNATTIRAELPQDSQVKVSGQIGEWYRVELNIQDQKTTGWIRSEQLTTAKSERPSHSEEKKPQVVFQNTPPTLTLLEPEQHEAVVEEDELVIQALAVTNKGIKNAVVTVNGKNRNIEVHRRNATQQSSQTVFRIEESVPLSYGLNTIELRVYDINSQTSEPIVLAITREREEMRNDYALLFGVNSYEHFDPWHKLTNPIPDAEAIGNELKNRYGFAVEVVEDPSRDEVLTKINEYARKQYNDNDQLLIFFAGHGYYEERNNIGIGYLVASDTFPPEADRGKSSYISHGDLRERIENIGCEHIFLIVDACFSGAFDAPVAQFNRARGANRIPDDVTKRQFIKQSLAYKTRWYLTSGGKEYVSDGTPNQHSPFTRRVLDALRSTGGGKHGILTLEDIGRYVEKATPQPRAGEFGTNAPGSNFLFIRK
ncbi:hypothetical protein C6503_05445 [Candidatus Poribacteria bacterium]|nr:MAG: hypothetical protein C6503_05445 [Candidatus Poribacteria bacterium]